MNETRILVVDDEPNMRKLVRDYLVREGYPVLEAEDGEQALNLFSRNKDIALVIMDVMMPKMNGYEAAEEIRKISKVPIILLTAMSKENDELKGFSVGADEYVTKPFSARVLVARVNAILRRTVQDTVNILECSGNKGTIRIDITAHQVSVDGKNVELSFKEFELLQFFMENQDRALSREKILNRVWNYDYIGDARTIDTHVKKLRAKLGETGGYIRTIWAMGYKFTTKEE